MTTNPYDPPEAPLPPAGEPPITLSRATVYVVVTTLVGGIGGSTLGMALAYFVPNYYRSLFPGGQSTGFDPFAVGVGLGLLQGLGAGFVFGLAIIIVVCWFSRRR